MSDPAYRQAVWAWHQHLRAGGSTPWLEWLAGRERRAPESPTSEPRTIEPRPPATWVEPGAAELELVRRAALRPEVPEDVLRALADLVVSRSAPGRGLAQQPLRWAGEGRRFGAPPVDPSEVPLEELLRVGAGVLAELLVTGPHTGPDTGPAARPRWSPVTRRPPVLLTGAPVTTAVVRRALGLPEGRPEGALGGRLGGRLGGGGSARVVVLAEPVDRGLAQVWSARVQGGSPVRWQGLVSRWVARDRLPPLLDAAALARDWSERVGPGRVDVLLAPVDPVRAVGELLGARPPRRRGDGGLGDLSPAGVEVVRRVNGVLGVRAHADRRALLRARLFALLAGTPGGRGGAPAVPEAHRGWAEQQAERQAERLAAGGAAGGYRVLGRPGDLGPGGGPTHPRRTDALDLLLDVSLTLADRPRTAGGGVTR